MKLVLVLTADPAKPVLDAATLAEFATAFGPARILAPGIAAELYPNDADPARILAAARAILGSRPVDANVVPAAGRKKRLLVADMESTLIENEMLDDLAERLGIGPRVAAITRRAMNGELDFRAALAERVGLLAGQDEKLLAQAAEGIRIVPGAAALAATMAANGALTAIVSGGFTFYTSRMRRQLGFARDYANTLEIENGKIRGTVAEPVLGREAKLATLEKLSAEIDAPLDATLSVGDGANDLAMLGAAGFGVAFRAKPAVAAQASLNIVHGDLTALLYLQGYAANEFATPKEAIA
ncbi:MAG: phosphoserine phosphatase SerB [Telmatospirillum sp.]|nr:phosphoserine phosphatase SerB [Telmatospirillum sp.]